MKFEFKHCKACGMPLLENSDFGGNNLKNDWCINCCNSDGSHKTYEEIVESMTNFMLTEQGEKISGVKHNSYEESKAVTILYLSKMPAFKKEN